MITPFQIIAFLLYLASAVLAIYLSSMIAQGGLEGFFEVFGVVAALVWLLLGSRVWSLPIFFAIGFGGMFYVGFKLYPYEVGFLAGMIAIMPTIILVRSFPAHRRRLPLTLIFCLFYLLLHCFISCVVYAGLHFGSVGTIGRTYFGGIWALIFVIVFYYYGVSRSFIVGLFLLEGAYTLRAGIDLAAYFYPSMLYLPGLNFVLPGQGQGGYYDLRQAGLGLTMLSLALLFDQKKGWHKRFQGGMLVFALICSAMGGGRLYLIISLFALLTAAVYSRKWLFVAAAPLSVVALVAGLNLNLIPLSELPDGAQRSLSIMIFSNREALGREMGTYGSDMWHERLREIAIERWTASPRSFLFGNGSQPFDPSIHEEASYHLFDAMLEEAANISSYEAGLWQCLAMLGLAGFLFYSGILGIFVRRVLLFYRHAMHDRWTKSITFYSIFSVFQWYVFSYSQGTLPSYEVMIVALASFYLQDRAAEVELAGKKRTTAADLILYS